MRFFADTSGWIAIFDTDDKYHVRAKDWITSLEGQGERFVTTDYILDETITHLLNAVNHATAEEFALWVLKQKQVRIIHITEELWHESLKLFNRYDDKDFSFTDCTSFVVMRRENLRDAFTFDHHFEQMGFRLCPR